MSVQRDGVAEDLLLILLLGALLGGGWWLFGQRLTTAAALISAAAACPAAWAADLLGPVRIPLLTPWLLEPSQAARDLLSAPLSELRDQAGTALTAGGRNAAFALAPFCLRAAMQAPAVRPDRAHRAKHDLDSAIAGQAKVWPAALRPMAFDPSADDQPETGVDSAARQELRALMREKSGRLGGGGLPETGSLMLCPQPDPVTPPPLGRAMRPEEWLDAHCLRRPDGGAKEECCFSV